MSSAATGGRRGVPALEIFKALDALDARSSIGTKTRPIETAVTPYLQAASALHVFDPETLQPVGGASPRSAIRKALFEASVPAVGWLHKRYRSLRLEVRAGFLSKITSRKAVSDVLAINPHREPTSLQRLFEAWVSGDQFDLRRLSFGQLENLELLRQWGLDGRKGFPSQPQLAEARARRSGVAVFEHLVDHAFVGRTAELDELRKHVGVTPPTAWDKLKGFFTTKTGSAFVIWGSGGVGKTALIGRLLLDYVESPNVWFPFVYQAFDSDALNVLEPFTLLVSARRQLEAQIPRQPAAKNSRKATPLEAALAQFDEAVIGYRRQRAHLSRRASTSASRSDRLRSSSIKELALYDEFAKLLNAVAAEAASAQGTRSAPLLWVLDTFEEVIFRTDEDLRGLWRMFESLCSSCPALKLVISSRTEPPSLPLGSRGATVRHVSDLEAPDAVHLLQVLGVEKLEYAQGIVNQVGRNPLTLRLAARVAAAESPSARGFEGIKTRSYWMVDVAPEVIRGQLYKRILDHIHDDGVRALAHPGMVLRRVTPKIIQGVLAPVCSLDVPSDEDAEELFEGLRREHSLVRLDSDGSLLYREEIRRPLLELLTRDRVDQVTQLHRQAVYFYTDIEGPVARAEEIYHRMMLDEEPKDMEGRWLRGVERYLMSAVTEVSPRHQVWLASHMSIKLPDSTEALASLGDWERQIGRRILSASRYESPEELLQYLTGRHDRTPESPLYAIEARALMQADRVQDAATLLVKAVSQWPALGNAGRLAELLWLGAQACATLGDEEGAVRMLRSLCEVTSGFTVKLALVQSLSELTLHLGNQDTLGPGRRTIAASLGLSEGTSGPTIEVSLQDLVAEITASRAQLAQAIDQLSSAEVDQERSMVRLALVRLGIEYPNTTARVLPWLLSDFGYVMNERWRDLAPQLPLIQDSLASLSSDEPSGLVKQLIAAISSSPDRVGPELCDGLATLVARGHRERALMAAIVSLFTAEGTSLTASTLSGIETYRDDFESDSSSEEVSA